jgi:hypothetical protein
MQSIAWKSPLGAHSEGFNSCFDTYDEPPLAPGSASASGSLSGCGSASDSGSGSLAVDSGSDSGSDFGSDSGSDSGSGSALESSGSGDLCLLLLRLTTMEEVSIFTSSFPSGDLDGLSLAQFTSA